MDPKDFLKGLAPDQIQQLGLDAETTAQLQGLQDVSMQPLPATPDAVAPTGSYSQDQIGRQMAEERATRFSSVPDQNLSMAQVDPVAFQAMNSGMTSAGMQPAQLPVPLAPVQGALPEDEAAAIQMAAAQEAETQVIRESAMQKAAQTQAVKQAEEETQKAEKIAAQDVQNEAKISEDLKQDAPSIGSQIGQAIAIMMGAYSQGLTGAKENPAIVAIEKKAEQIAAARKYSDEQKIKLAEMLYKQTQQQIEQRKNTIDSMIGLKKLEQADQEIAIKMQELATKKTALQNAGKTTYTNAERIALQGSGKEGRELAETFIRLPNGDWAPAVSGATAEDLRKNVIPGLNNAAYHARKIKDAVKFFGNNPAKKAAAFAEKGALAADVQGLVGALRLEYFGPGVMTDTEQQLARDMIGNPAKIFSLASANAARIESIAQKLNYARRQRYRDAGVELPESPNERKVREFLAIKPKYKREEVIDLLVKKGLWDPNEE